MDKASLRKDLYKKYIAKIPKLKNDIYSIDETIDYLKGCVKILDTMLHDVEEYYSDNEYRYFGSVEPLSKDSNNKYQKIFDDLMNEQEREEIISNQIMINILKFLYNDNNKEDEITRTELTYMKMLIVYSIFRFNELIAYLNSDYYFGRYKLKKRFQIFKKCYYDFYVDNDKVGSGWVKIRNTILSKGVYLKIKPEYRRKKYGTRFYRLLLYQTDDKVDNMIIKVSKKDKVANAFVQNFFNEYDMHFSILNTNIYIQTIMIE